MLTRSLLVGLATCALGAVSLPAQTAAPRTRSIRRDIPLTNMIRRAYAAGTRDTTGQPTAKYWQLWMDYSIDARLDPATSTVTGRETAVIHNTSAVGLDAVQVRLDQNIFRPGAERAETDPGVELTTGMTITRIAYNGTAIDLNAPSARRTVGRGPALREELLATTARIPLPAAIPPGGSGSLQFDWSFKVPAVEGARGMRMGRWGDTLYQVAQWYPRVAVYDDLRGWDTEPYLGPSEFYNNFGRFDVRLDVPAGWLVGATGVLQNAPEVLSATARDRLSHVLESDQTHTIIAAGEQASALTAGTGGRTIWHFVADTVGDVAWAASPRFVWDATRASIPGRGDIPVNILYLPGDAQGSAQRPGFAQAGPILQHALAFYSRLWMPYTFPQLTMVDGPELGMEYPMFIMSGPFAADHETGHQWWPMMVGTNETWYGWMDEGFNQYMNILSRDDAQHRPAQLDGAGQQYGEISGNELEPPLMWDANYAGPLYGFQAYGKAPMMLSALGGVVGDTAVWRAMSGYAHAWRFKHPSPWDYANYMSSALHRDLGWFWYYWLFTTASVDGSIQNVRTEGGRTVVTVRQDGDMPSPIVLGVDFAPGGAPIRSMTNARMIDATHAEVTWPVDVWFGGNRTYDARLEFGSRRIEKITLDPHRRFPDRDTTDNVWPRPR